MKHNDTSTANVPRENIEHFLPWCFSALGWAVVAGEDGARWLQIPESLRSAFGGCEAIPVPVKVADLGGSPLVPSTSIADRPDWHRPFSWVDVLQALGKLDRQAHAAPACQPTSVHELTPRLFDAYTVEGGRVMLGGCSLEDQPLVRSTGLIRCGDDPQAWQLVHRFTTIEGQPIDPKLVASLHLDQLVPLRRPPRLPPADLASWAASGRRQLPESAQGVTIEPLLVTIVWCKYLHCKLTFEIGDARADLPFSSWAQWLTDGDVSPPPFRCRHSGRESFRIVGTDDGQITVAEAIATCERTGRRVLESRLATCELTGRRVLRELLASCPISGERLLADQRVTCAMCGEVVSPKSAIGSQCLACRDLQPVLRDDPRIARVFGEHPKLEQWSRWRLSETATVYILRGSSFFRRLLVVLERESLDPLRLAEGSFLSRRWSPIAPEQWNEYLR